MTKIFFTMQPEGSSNSLVYHAGNLIVVITLDRSMKVSDSYSFFLYNSQLMLIDDAETGDSKKVERTGRSLKMTMATPSVWIPGNYFLLMRSGKGNIQRFDIELGECGNLSIKPPRVCKKMSAEDILSGSLCNNLNLWRRLSRRPGLQQLKAWALNRCQENEVNEMRRLLLGDDPEHTANLLLTARSERRMPTTVMLLKMTTAIPGELKSVNCSELFNPSSSDPYEKLRSTFSDLTSSDNILQISLPTAKNFVFSYDHLNSLFDTGGKVIIKEMMRHWPGNGNSCILIGTQQELDTLLEQNPSLQQHFPRENRLCEELYSQEEMIHLFFSETDIAKLRLTAEAKYHACRMLIDAYQQGQICQWTADDMRRYIKEVLEPAYLQNTVACIKNGQQTDVIPLLQPSDLDAAPLLSPSTSLDEAMKELNAMVGLNSIKKSIITLSNRMRFYAERRQLGLSTTDDASYHAIFTGNPGTGKTTVAKLLGRIYHSLGLLSRGEVICADRSTMIGRYIGETEEIMKHLLQEARGNVLFVDEAYTLYNKNDDKDFGRHAIEALLDVLSQRRPDMLIVFAGYQEEMDQLMTMNPGLQGRFPYKFCFNDYNATELMQIAEEILRKDQYELTAEAHNLLLRKIGEATASSDEHFSNARWIGQLVRNGIIPAMADRMSKTPHTLERSFYQRIECSDIQAAFEQFSPRSKEMHQRRAIGFCA